MRGFSLIELMVVIAIVAILASIAVPAYKNFVIRSRMTEIVVAGQVYRNQILEYHNQNGTGPVTPADLGYTVQNTNYIADAQLPNIPYLSDVRIFNTSGSTPHGRVNLEVSVSAIGITVVSGHPTIFLSYVLNYDSTKNLYTWTCFLGGGPPASYLVYDPCIN